MSLIASTAQKAVIGLGVTGLACARFWQARGRPFVLIDTRDELANVDTIAKEFVDSPMYLGEVPATLWQHIDEVVVSPGVALEHPLVVAAIDAGVAVMGDIDVFMAEAKAPVVGITGSNAKSTVTELLGHLAQSAGVNVAVGGNLGTPALELLDDDVELYVLELSSFQLERAGTLGLSVATVLNVSPDHLDRHGDMQRYHRAKHRIFFACKAAVFNRDDMLTQPLVPPQTPLQSFGLSAPDIRNYGVVRDGDEVFLCRGGKRLINVDKLSLAGRHNWANVLAALALGEMVGLRLEQMLDAVVSFDGLPHRCALVTTASGVRYINDSKGTNVGAVMAALEGIGEQNNIVLIAGGQGKGADFAELVAPVSKYCKHLVLIGESATEMTDILAEVVSTETASTMQEAVEKASAIAAAGDVVLLSPACASFDMFSGYAERGEQFEHAVYRVTGVAA
ncbi:MAG: UDP-N-acetylmuramoyl-L-alanine--D-glutamate ligase [Gammaproteobacteria bacterium]|nr:MAG: UDP-N-acetylmuramoyl-L-alanine--D-glutamate ligase [Gammaproteobacteria bacterium]